MSNVLETYIAGLFNNEILRDSNGKPSFFVRHPKVNSSFFDASLPDSPHPAFVCGSDVDSAVLIGKYHSSELTSGGALYSLPNAAPVRNVSYANMMGRARTENWVPMTIFDYGLILLIAQHYGFKGRHGNTLWGAEYGGAVWNPNIRATAGQTMQYLGWSYETLITHTMAEGLEPTNAPAYFKKIAKIGGTCVPTDAYKSNRTYTGSGPLSWYFLDDINMEADIAGDVRNYIAGARISDGEIQIIPTAANPLTDVSPESEEWKAILPHNADNGYDLVTPGTTGTIKYAWINDTITLIARSRESEEVYAGNKSDSLYNIAIESSSLPYVPSILYECAFAPLPNVTDEHKVDGNYNIYLGTGTRYCMFGRGYGSNARGLASLAMSVNSSDTPTGTGIRHRARELA